MDPEAIYAEVERRKKRAEEMGIRETVWALYKNHLKSYPRWTAQTPEYIHPRISEPLELPRQGVRVTIGGRKFSFLYEESPPLCPPIPGEVATFGTFSLMIDDLLVLEFYVHGACAMKEYAEWEYSMSLLNAFVEGPWVEELQRLLPGVRGYEGSVAKRRVQQQREDPEKLEELKERFGL